MKIMIESWFSNFLNFFAIFFGICSPGSSMCEIRVSNSFIPFSAYLILYHHVLPKNNAGKLFFDFFAIFLEFSPTGRVWAEFGSKILLSHSRPMLSYLIPFWLKITPERCFLYFLNFFAIFFGIFSPGSSMSGIRV